MAMVVTVEIVFRNAEDRNISETVPAGEIKPEYGSALEQLKNNPYFQKKFWFQEQDISAVHISDPFDDTPPMPIHF